MFLSIRLSPQLLMPFQSSLCVYHTAKISACQELPRNAPLRLTKLISADIFCTVWHNGKHKPGLCSVRFNVPGSRLTHHQGSCQVRGLFFKEGRYDTNGNTRRRRVLSKTRHYTLGREKPQRQSLGIDKILRAALKRKLRKRQTSSIPHFILRLPADK